MTDMALTALVKRMDDEQVKNDTERWLDVKSGRRIVTHGFRSSMRDWAAEETHYPGEMAEMALAHAVGNKVEAAYRRGDMFEKRRQMMADWATWCEPKKTSAAVPIRGKAAA
jgi:integrase